MWLPLAVAQGKIPGHSQVFKFGYNPLTSSTEETVWDFGGSYVYPSAASQMTVSSGDAVDTATGTGAQTISISGLDENYFAASEEIALSGQTAVSTVNSYIRMFRAQVLTAGSGETNAGILYVGTGTVTSGVPANKFTTIAVGEGQTLQAFYTIPANTTGYLYQVIASMFGNQNVFLTIRLCMREFGGIMAVRDKFTISRGEVIIPHEFQAEVPAKTDIEMRAVSSGADVDCSASFGLVLIRDGFKQRYLE